MENEGFVSSDLKQVVYRRAEARDYQGVLDISEGLYGGRDILPAMYHNYLKDPLRMMNVAVYRGKVISFHIHRIIDNGTTVESEAARSDKAVRGLGVIHRMEIISLKEVILPRFPGVKRIRAVTVNVQGMSHRRGVKFIPRSLKSVIDIAWKVPVSAIRNALKLYQSKKSHTQPLHAALLQKANRSDLEEMFIKNEFKNNYIPAGILVRDSQSFDLDYPENIPLLLGDRCQKIFISRDSKDQMTSISFGTGIEMGVTMETYRYTIDYYGLPDLNLFKTHIMQHMGDIPYMFNQSKTAKDIYINIWALDETFSKSEFKALIGFTSYDLALDSGSTEFAQQIVMVNRESLNDLVKAKI